MRSSIGSSNLTSNTLPSLLMKRKEPFTGMTLTVYVPFGSVESNAPVEVMKSTQLKSA